MSWLTVPVLASRLTACNLYCWNASFRSLLKWSLAYSSLYRPIIFSLYRLKIISKDWRKRTVGRCSSNFSSTLLCCTEITVNTVFLGAGIACYLCVSKKSYSSAYSFFTNTINVRGIEKDKVLPFIPEECVSWE